MAKVEPFQVVPWDVVRARITRLVFRFLRDRATEKCAQFLPARLLSQPLYRVYTRARNDTRPPYDTEFSILKATIPLLYRDENHLLRIYIYIFPSIYTHTYIRKLIFIAISLLKRTKMEKDIRSREIFRWSSRYRSRKNLIYRRCGIYRC